MSYINQKVKNSSAIFLATTISLLFSPASLADKYLDNAKKYIEKNEISSAVIELKNSIQNSPQDADPRLLLGEIYRQQGSYLDAEKQFMSALELGASKEEVAPLLLRTKLNIAKNHEVIDYVNNNRFSDSYINSELLALKAIAELNLNQVEDAKQSLQLAGDTALDSQYVKLSQARLDAAQKNIEQALQIVEDVINKNSSNTDAWILKGHLDMAKQDFASAADSYGRAYQLSPQAAQYTLFIARALVLDGQMDKAEPYIDNILNQAPNQLLANDLKATVDFSKNEFASAKLHADRALNNGSSNLVTSLISGVSAYKLKLYEQANNRLKQTLPRLPENHFARRLYIITQLKLGYIDEAIQELQQLNPNSKENSDFLSHTSLSLSKLGRDEEALELAQKAYDGNNGQFNEATLGIVKLSSKDTSGFEDLKSALAEQPDKRKSEIAIAYYYLQLGAIDEANNIAEKWLNTNSDDVDVLVLKGTILRAQKKTLQSKETYVKALSINPEHPQANLLYSQLLASLQQWDEAFEYSYKAKTLEPNNNLATQLIFTSAKYSDKSTELLDLINRQISQYPDNIELIPQKSMAMVLLGESDRALELLEKLSSQDKTATVWAMIGNIYFSRKRWSDAERAYLKWLEKSPTDINAHIRSIFVSNLTEKYGFGLVLAERAENLFPNDVRILILKTDLLIKMGKPNDAQKTLDSLPSNIQQLDKTLQQQSKIYIAKNQLNKAFDILEKRYRIYPSLESAKELVIIYSQNNQNSKAIEFLYEVLEQYPEKAKPLQLLLADIESKSTPDKAIKQYKEIISREPNNIVALNNLSWIYIEKQQYSQACQYSEQAYSLSNGHPQISDTHGYCLLKLGNVKEAVSILEQAYKAISTVPEVALHYTESLIADGQVKQAKNVLSRIVTSDSKYLEQIKSLEIELSRI